MYFISQSSQNLWLFCVFAMPEGGAVGQQAEDRRLKVAELQAVFRNTGFPFHMVPLEQVSAGAAASAAVWPHSMAFLAA